jgi:hypothetical protein
VEVGVEPGGRAPPRSVVDGGDGVECGWDGGLGAVPAGAFGVALGWWFVDLWRAGVAGGAPLGVDCRCVIISKAVTTGIDAAIAMISEVICL